MTRRSIDDWLNEYGESHQNPVNKRFHWVCVPLITACVLALFGEIPLPSFIRRFPYVNGATLLVAASMVFYLRLSIPLALGMFVFSAGLLFGIAAVDRSSEIPVWQIALIVFAIAWVGQFIGHSIEGKKPSFFKDIQFLLIGPVWLLAFIYRRFGIRY
jgi:uncharacterized membrane protein YGL010W